MIYVHDVNGLEVVSSFILYDFEIVVK